MNIFNQINQNVMKNLISLKAIALFVSMLAALHLVDVVMKIVIAFKQKWYFLIM